MEISLYSLLGLFSFSFLNRNQKIIIKNKEKLKELKEHHDYTPNELLSHLKNASFSKTDSFKIDENDKNLIKGSCFLEGVAFSNHPLKSKINNNQLLYSDYRLERFYSNDIKGIINGNDQILKNREIRGQSKLIEASPYFYIYEKDAGRNAGANNTNNFESIDSHRCKIEKNLGVNANHAIIFLDSKITRTNVSIFDKFVMSIFYLLETIFFKSLKFRGVGVGYIEKEFGIKNGAFLKIYGEILYDIKNKMAKMNKPEFFFQKKEDLINEIRNNIRKYKLISFFVMIPFLICVYKLFLYIKQKIKSYLESRGALKKYKKSKLVIENFKCSICQNNTMNLISFPCEHLCICKDCYLNKMKEKICPKCKTEITDVEEIFFP